MTSTGIFFGTDTGTTRLIAKKIARLIGDDAAKPLNVNRTTPQQLLDYDVLILGTPSYGEGCLPGLSTGVRDGSWQEFLPQLADLDLSGKQVALYGLGNQEKYSQRFADALYELYSFFTAKGAEIIGRWPTEGYQFESSRSVVDGRFVGLVIDNHCQGLLTEQRLADWLEQLQKELRR